MRRFNSRLGRCYELAFNKVCGFPGDREINGILVHGIIRDTHLSGKGAVICHAWVDIDGMVWEPISETTLPASVFMRLYDAEVVHHYSMAEAARLALDTGTSGPWETMPDHMQKTLRQIETEAGT